MVIINVMIDFYIYVHNDWTIIYRGDDWLQDEPPSHVCWFITTIKYSYLWLYHVIFTINYRIQPRISYLNFYGGGAIL